jgi:3',5'-cyclic AMP phosphodiesterase CpdA
MFTFAHLSDIHLPPLPKCTLPQLFSKRILGYLSWQRKRKYIHSTSVLQALRLDLKHIHPDHICITGDLTNIALPKEIDTAARWLTTLGNCNTVSIVPGNHDAYTPSGKEYMLKQWRPWMSGDNTNHTLTSELTFPYVRIRQNIAFIGVSSAISTAPFFASGRCGQAQLAELKQKLTELKKQNLLRVILIHHPPIPGLSKRKALHDQAAFAKVIQERGAELVLHGHIHTPLHTTLQGPTSTVPIIGAGSSSSNGAMNKPTAHYHFISVTNSNIIVEHRYFDNKTGSFISQSTQGLALP